MQRSKARDKVGVKRNEAQTVKPPRSYNPHDQVVTEISKGPYPLANPHMQLIAHLKGKDYVRWPLKMQGNPAL